MAGSNGSSDPPAVPGVIGGRPGNSGNDELDPGTEIFVVGRAGPVAGIGAAGAIGINGLADRVSGPGNCCNDGIGGNGRLGLSMVPSVLLAFGNSTVPFDFTPGLSFRNGVGANGSVGLFLSICSYGSG